MEVTEEQLRARYSALDTNDLAKLYHAGGFTDLAIAVLRDVISSRDMAWDKFIELGATNAAQPAPGGKLTVGRSAADADVAESPRYFTTSTIKLALMSICTFGLYQLYWFYKNWVLIRDRAGSDITPFWRAFFAPIWAYSFFQDVKTSARECNVDKSLPSVLLAVLYFILQAMWRIPDPYWLVSFLSFILLLPANNIALRINQKLMADFTNNARFSVWNWAGLIVGGVVVALSVSDQWERRNASRLAQDAIVAPDGGFFQVRILGPGWSQVDSGYLSDESDLEFLGPDEWTWAVVYDSTGNSVDDVLAYRINAIKDEYRKPECEQRKTIVEQELVVRGILECTGRDVIDGYYIFATRVLSNETKTVEIVAHTSQLSRAMYNRLTPRVRTFTDGLELTK